MIAQRIPGAPEGFESFAYRPSGTSLLPAAVALARLTSTTTGLLEAHDWPERLEAHWVDEQAAGIPELSRPLDIGFLPTWFGPGQPAFRAMTHGPTAYNVFVLAAQEQPEGGTIVDSGHFELARPGSDHAGAMVVRNMFRHIIVPSRMARSDYDRRLQPAAPLNALNLAVRGVAADAGDPQTSSRWRYRIDPRMPRSRTAGAGDAE